MMKQILVASGLLLLGLAAAPNASADVAGLPPAELSLPLDAAAAEVAPLPCRTVAGDWDRDAENEDWNVCSTPACGCACPVVGAGVVVEVADAEHGAWVATSGCQTGFATMDDDADADGSPVTPFVWTWGLPPIATN